MRRAFIIRGHVQGVGFRWWTVRTAQRLDLSGYVMNRPDGSVFVDVDGDETNIDRLRDELANGPPTARVEDITEVEPGGGSLPADFRIEY